MQGDIPGGSMRGDATDEQCSMQANADFVDPSSSSRTVGRLATLPTASRPAPSMQAFVISAID
eukprot:4428314-Alexandrium_andersonii.AAC.1